MYLCFFFFYIHRRGDWTARLVCGCNYWPRHTIPFPNCSLCDRASRCASPAAAFEVREDRVGHAGYDWARRSSTTQGSKAKGVVTIDTANRQRLGSRVLFQVQRWTFAALRSDGARVRCNGACTCQPHDVPKFKPC